MSSKPPVHSQYQIKVAEKLRARTLNNVQGSTSNFFAVGVRVHGSVTLDKDQGAITESAYLSKGHSSRYLLTPCSMTRGSRAGGRRQR